MPVNQSQERLPFSVVFKTQRIRPLHLGLLGLAIVALGACGGAQLIDNETATDSEPVQAPIDESEADAGIVGAAETSSGQATDATTSIPAPPTTTTAPTTTEAPEPTTTVPPTTVAPTAIECAANVPLEVRLGQLLFPVMVQSEFAAATELAAGGHIGGIVVLGNPDATIRSDIAALEDGSLIGDLIVAVDEEGGRVQRLADLVGRLPSARAVASTGDIEAASVDAEAHARALGELGFTMNLAPVVDLDTGVFIGDRSYGPDPDVVTDFSFAVADGIRRAGLSPVIKHFPGHGAGTDSHTGLPTVPAVDQLRASDLVPFQRAIDRAGAEDITPIMIGHVVVPDLTNGAPASLSRAAVTDLLRDELGFDGLVMTDALNMDAIAATTSNAVAAELALDAGVDLVMLGGIHEVAGTIDHLMDAIDSDRLSEETVTESFVRVLEHRDLDLCTLPGDLAASIGCGEPGTDCQ